MALSYVQLVVALYKKLMRTWYKKVFILTEQIRKDTHRIYEERASEKGLQWPLISFKD